MIEDLKTRLDELHRDLEVANGDQREELLDHLEQVVLALEDKDVDIPGWAKALMASRVDEAVEDMFDNMPV
ncbi:hypothetical protein TRP8649_03675 [Pelagimonas phthalicica]|uniref:Uncharacterized protein n=1 Tax=Pelagimonas phthalicica TaxID=1037362 RepID=A0A238JFT3_9RHOB|nr:hypothetical protein [Pelagimonas phthalicica]TDS92466.1 hypothetical protein CLV87_3670 [Pelagimonas phthalicica]SMX29538.1 hypothetical protein TRP8649_03675 [Pelagimonas phthalicica]